MLTAVQVIVFTAYAGHAAIGAALDAGASGVLTKDCGQAALLSAIRRAASGEAAVNVGRVPCSEVGEGEQSTD